MFKKKTKTTTKPNQRIITQRTLPVDRYYSSMSARRAAQGDRGNRIYQSQSQSRTRAQGDRAADIAAIARRPAHTFSQLVAGGLRWAGFVAIVIVILFNIVLSGVGVKVSPQQLENVYRKDEDYVAAVNTVFSSSAFHRTKATFDSKSFEETLQRTLPEVTTATAVVPAVGLKLQVGLKIARPLCRVQLDTTRQGIVAENGVIVFEGPPEKIASIFSELKLLRVEPAVSLKTGDALLTTQEVDLVRRVNAEFDGSSNDRPAVSEMTYEVTKRGMTARFEDAAYYIRFTTVDRDAPTQVGAALATLRQLLEQGGAPKEYIDVRVSGRVFVK